MLEDTEFRLEIDHEGRHLWTWENEHVDTKSEVLRMLVEGQKGKEIARTLGITTGRVSQIKSGSISEGLIKEDDKTKRLELTQAGQKYVSRE